LGGSGANFYWLRSVSVQDQSLSRAQLSRDLRLWYSPPAPQGWRGGARQKGLAEGPDRESPSSRPVPQNLAAGWPHALVRGGIAAHQGETGSMQKGCPSKKVHPF